MDENKIWLIIATIVAVALISGLGNNFGMMNWFFSGFMMLIPILIVALLVLAILWLAKELQKR